MQGSYRLDSPGLTLAAGPAGAAGTASASPRQIDADRVDLGDGVQDGGRATCSTSATQPGRTPDTSSLNSKWGHLGYDSVVLDDPGQQDGSTIVVGSVRGTPTSVTVSIDATSAPATIACFRQASGWCSYKANVPSRSPATTKRSASTSADGRAHRHDARRDLAAALQAPVMKQVAGEPSNRSRKPTP